MEFTLKNTATALVPFLLAFMAIGQETKAESILEEFHHQPDKILVAAHRAAHQNFAENSIAAIQESIRMDVDIVELDVRMTKDSVLVILHDRTVDRTTNGSGELSTLTFEEARSFQLLHQGKPTEQVIPTLEEVLSVTKDKIVIDIDFKADSKEALVKTVDLIKQYGMERQIIFFLYDYTLAPVLHTICPELIIMPRAYSKRQVKRILEWDYIKIIHVDESFYRERLMKKIIDSKVRVWINALGTYDNMEKEEKNSGFAQLLSKKYINVIQTDLPEELTGYLNTFLN